MRKHASLQSYSLEHRKYKKYIRRTCLDQVKMWRTILFYCLVKMWRKLNSGGQRLAFVQNDFEKHLRGVKICNYVVHVMEYYGQINGKRRSAVQQWQRRRPQLSGKFCTLYEKSMRIEEWFADEPLCSIKGSIHRVRENFSFRPYSEGVARPSKRFFINIFYRSTL